MRFHTHSNCAALGMSTFILHITHKYIFSIQFRVPKCQAHFIQADKIAQYGKD